MHRQLEQIIHDFDAALDRVRRLDREYADEAWMRRPAEGAWSAAECIAHLNLTSEDYLALLRDGLERARTSGDASPERFRSDLVGWLIWKSVGPGGRFRARTIPRFVPASPRPKGELVNEFERLQKIQMECVRAADGLPIQRIKIASPFNPKLRYSLYSAFKILPAHQHRHLGQAERALQEKRG